MEPRASWNLLTACLASVDLAQPPFVTWAFLVVQDLVRDGPGDRDRFVQIVSDVIAEPAAGPSAAWRVAQVLEQAGMARAAAQASDPCGRLAQARARTLREWR